MPRTIWRTVTLTVSSEELRVLRGAAELTDSTTLLTLQQRLARNFRRGQSPRTAHRKATTTPIP